MNRLLVKFVNLLMSRNTLLLVIYLIVGALVIPHYCRTLPYSVFYVPHPKHDRQVVLERNEHRTKNALAYLQSINSTYLQNLSNISNAEFCFVMVTSKRPQETHYLTQVVGTLLPQIIADKKVIFAIYNTDGPTHKDAVSLSSIVPVIDTQTITSHNSKSSLSLALASFDKEREDYSNALEWCSKTNATFSAVIEDDALPQDDFVSRLRFILNYRMNKQSKKWLYLKLFYPEKFQGWGNDLIFELVALSVAGGLFLTLLSFILLCENIRKVNRSSLLLRLIISSLFTTYFLMVVSRPHIMAMRKISVYLSSVSLAPGCCTPALLFPNHHLQKLVEYLRSVHCSSRFPIDLAVDKFADDRGFQRLLVEPNMFRHIGYLSSLPGKGWKNVKEFMI